MGAGLVRAACLSGGHEGSRKGEWYLPLSSRSLCEGERGLNNDRNAPTPAFSRGRDGLTSDTLTHMTSFYKERTSEMDARRLFIQYIREQVDKYLNMWI